MKPVTYFLVDFENLQPAAADIGRIRADEHRLWVFHGPHQNKFSADMVVAWQPLGDRVRFVQSSKSGKNALDFHIAYYLGALNATNKAEGRPARYVVVTGDGGFDAIFNHMRGLGCAVGKAATIADALALAESLDALASPKSTATPSKTATTIAPTDSDQVARPFVRPSKGIIMPAPPAQPKKAKTEKTTSAARKVLGAGDVDKVIANLRAHSKNRPADRKALERHVISILGNGVAGGVARAAVNELEQRRVIAFNGKAIVYNIPKDKK